MGEKKNQFNEKINIIVKPQARLTKRKTQIITNSNKTYYITIVPTDFKRIIKEDLEALRCIN